jgi:6-pyruvoyltetrahydropterin/6-carboxytetrahydropterin synthase
LIRVTRRYRFSASHRLCAAQLSDDENRALYGKCSNPYGHGHDYVLEVSVRGPVDRASGKAVDLSALDGLVRAHVVEAFDHHYLNAEVPAFSATVPTTENLALEVRSRLVENWAGAFPDEWPKLEKVRIQETKRNAFELSE